ncbi:MAG: 4-alpha-glucanotransferase [Candidatus Omnitrophota bacterium]|nr:MAG: 4-alpha-glucanotransferase [Candidatus Omnitrophota bacterium]
MGKRGSGVLLHITSLPSKFGIGDMGAAAYQFADFLFQSKQKYWQILPLNPTNLININSPYSSVSAFAGNIILISPELLAEDGLLSCEYVKSLPQSSEQRVDYEVVYNFKTEILSKAYESFKDLEARQDYNNFCRDQDYWLVDFALFIAFKEYFQGKMWSQWPKEIRDRNPEAMRGLAEKLAENVEKQKFMQYVFFKQWFTLKNYCQNKGIEIIGDVPIYVTYDSVDVWANPGIFKLDENKQPLYLAGVPPDYFSSTGQLWGNPVYDWDALKNDGYAWWIQRIEYNLKIFSRIRIDHFRGFVDFWQVPAGQKDAVNGAWQKAPADDFFQVVLDKFPDFPLIAEDLGIISDDVKRVMHKFAFPGMKILLFAFGEDMPEHPYLPHNYTQNCVVYTGTHDNNTVKGWFENETGAEDKKRLFIYFGRDIFVSDLHWEMIRLALMSVANIAIFPMQDILGLGETQRMNLPGTVRNNWQWRVLPDQLNAQLSSRICKMTEVYNRA